MGRAEISDHVPDESDDPTSNLIELYVQRLRRKVDSGFHRRLIHTRRGEGYQSSEQLSVTIRTVRARLASWYVAALGAVSYLSRPVSISCSRILCRTGSIANSGQRSSTELALNHEIEEQEVR